MDFLTKPYFLITAGSDCCNRLSGSYFTAFFLFPPFSELTEWAFETTDLIMPSILHVLNPPMAPQCLQDQIQLLHMPYKDLLDPVSSFRFSFLSFSLCSLGSSHDEMFVVACVPCLHICSVCLECSSSHKTQFRNQPLWKAFPDFIKLGSGATSICSLAFHIELYQNRLLCCKTPDIWLFFQERTP